jgi:Fe-S cluster biogenesis protein NfuA
MSKEKNNIIEEKIKKSLETVRPSLQADGGDIEFVSFDEKSGVVKVRMLGMCSGCPMMQMTLKEGVEAIVKKEVPEVNSVTNDN